MDKKKIFIYSFALVLIISISFLIYKSTFSYDDSDKYLFDDVVSVNVDKNKLQELIVRTAYAFYDKNEYIQYDSGSLSSEETKYMFREFNVTPEDISANNYVLMDNVSFLFLVYMNALHYDLSSLNGNNANLLSGSNFSLADLKIIAENTNDVRNILTGYTEYYTIGNSVEEAFISDFNAKLELGDIVIYKIDNEISAFLYLGDNKYMYASGKNYTAGNSDFLENGTLYITDNIFIDGKLDRNVEYYSILRPVNEMCDNQGNANGVNIPVNSLSRVDDIFISRYTDVTTDEVYRGQEFIYNIKIKNNSNDEITIYEVKDIIDDKLTYVEEISTYSANLNNEIITWNNVRVSANDEVILSYKVKVNGEYDVNDINSNDSLVGTVIDSSKATIKLNEDSYEMRINQLDFKIEVLNNNIQEEMINDVVTKLFKQNGTIEYSTDSIYQDDYKTDIDSLTETNPIHLYSYSFIKFIYYNSLGIDLGNNDGVLYENTILNSLFTYDTDSDSYLRLSNTSDLSTVGQRINYMLVDGMYGGRLLGSVDDRSKMITTPHYSSVTDKFSYTYQEFIPGDVISYWNMNSNNDLIAYSYMYLGNEYNSDTDSYSGKLIRYSGTGITLLTGSEADEVINNLYSSSLYAILRPSKISYLRANSIQVEDIVVSVGNEKSISYVKNPANATIVDISVTTDSTGIFEITKNNTIKGIGSGSGTINVTFNMGNSYVTKTVNVIVTNEEDIITFDTKYDVDYDNKIIYIGFENKVDTIINNLKFNENVEVLFENLSAEVVTDEITEDVNMKIIFNDVLIDTYKVVSVNSDTLIYDTRDNEEVIKYFDVGTTVSDLQNILRINATDLTIAVTVFDKDDQESLIKIGDSTLATGDIIDIKLSDNLSKRYIISVVGDVNGDGSLKLSDLIRVRRHFVEYVNPITQVVEIQTGANYFSMDINKDGNVRLTDINAFRKRLIEEYE